MPTPPHAPTATVHHWSNRPTDSPMPLLERKHIIGEHAMISRVHLRKGFVLSTHHHANEQFGVVLSGRIRFGLGPEGSSDRRYETLGPEQVIHFPSNFPHSAEALEDTIILDIFSPPSEKTGIDKP